MLAELQCLLLIAVEQLHQRQEARYYLCQPHLQRSTHWFAACIALAKPMLHNRSGW